MRGNPLDPYDLEGKRLKQVVPQVRTNLRIQRIRAVSHVIAWAICLALGYLGTRTYGLLIGFGVVGLVMTPFTFFAIYADLRLMRWHQQRLAECERRISAEHPD